VAEADSLIRNYIERLRREFESHRRYKMLIFLDIDGVMVPTYSWRVPENLEDGFYMFSEKATKALNLLINEKTSIILSTSHRFRFTEAEWLKIFKRRGIEIQNVKYLPQTFEKRKDQILNWLEENDVEDFIIIDDDRMLNSLPDNLKERLILTSPMIGLLEEHIAGRTSG
jgi:hypothetical protein